MQNDLATEERRRKFFFAEGESGLYDASIELTTPLYRLMHETLLQLAKAHLLKYAEQKEIIILDIGSGTGEESIKLMRLFPTIKVVAVDLCAPMHKQFKAKLIDQGLSLDRVRFVTGDIIGEQCTVSALQDVLQGFASQQKGYDMVISALTIHHLTTKEKMEAYQRIVTLLNPRGLFLNSDFFTYEAESVAQQAHKYGCDWIYRQFTTPDPEYKDMQEQLGDLSQTLRDGWLHHYNHDNLPDPVHGRGGRAQASMLFNLGFSHVECPFMFWELGILWALK